MICCGMSWYISDMSWCCEDEHQSSNALGMRNLSPAITSGSIPTLIFLISSIRWVFTWCQQNPPTRHREFRSRGLNALLEAFLGGQLVWKSSQNSVSWHRSWLNYMLFRFQHWSSWLSRQREWPCCKLMQPLVPSFPPPAEKSMGGMLQAGSTMIDGMIKWSWSTMIDVYNQMIVLKNIEPINWFLWSFPLFFNHSESSIIGPPPAHWMVSQTSTHFRPGVWGFTDDSFFVRKNWDSRWWR